MTRDRRRSNRVGPGRDFGWMPADRNLTAERCSIPQLLFPQPGYCCCHPRPLWAAKILQHNELGKASLGKMRAFGTSGLGAAVQTLWQDLRFAVRMLKRSPGFAAVAVLTLAVAIGANAVVFSALNGLILRPLNVPHPETLYQVGGPDDPSRSYPDYLDLRDRNHSFDGLAACNINQVSLEPGKTRRPPGFLK
jgi:hypothetical protein